MRLKRNLGGKRRMVGLLQCREIFLCSRETKRRERRKVRELIYLVHIRNGWKRGRGREGEGERVSMLCYVAMWCAVCFSLSFVPMDLGEFE